MKISRKYRSNEERTILIGMVMSDHVLSVLCPQLGKIREPFRSKWSNIIAGWCVNHFRNYNKAPGKIVESLFGKYAQKHKDEDTIQLIEKFLVGLSGEYENKGVNEKYILDLASDYFNQVKLEHLVQDIEAELSEKNIGEARHLVAGFNSIGFGGSNGVDVYSNTNSLKKALTDDETEVLVRYPGPLGEFFGRHLGRDCFIAFMAPEKRGKSFWLIDVAWRASVVERRKTVFYSVGDMSEAQMMRRFATRAARRPLGPDKVSWPKEIRIRDGETQTRRKVKEFEGRLSLKEAKAGMDRVLIKTATRHSLLKLYCTSNGSTTVADMRAEIDLLISQNWIPDVIVIDYADILAPEDGAKEEYRHQINKTWMALRRLSQDYHTLVVTATQSDAASYEAHTLSRKHFSEDKRKIGHVTGMIGINQTEEEKKKDIYRLNYLALREAAYFESRFVTVAGCLALANPAVCSAWVKKDS